VTRLCGADGCRTGWVAITEDLATGGISRHVASSLPALAAASPPADLIALDVPIGLTDAGPRACDLAARRLLGPGRSSSVFPAPLRALLEASSHLDACAVRERIEGKRLPIQAWAIVPKIREVDAALRGDPELRARVREVHPEICFFHLAGGRPMAHAKKTPAGRAERLALLRPAFGPAVDAAMDDRHRLGCGADDVLDAFVALWTARRVWQGKAVILPTTPPRDRYGLPMEMVA
jgi:predicted RNase H-like nuclease